MNADLLAEMANLISYDPVTGGFTWVGARSQDGHCNKHLGGKAGTTYPDSYVRVRYKGKCYLAHRLAWALTHGAWPAHQIDHINMDRADNRLINLREATLAENNRNKKVRSDSTTGFKGVSFNKATRKFVARLTVNKKTVHLEYHDTAEAAHESYIRAAEIHHGQFARH